MEQETYLDRIKQLKSHRKITNEKLSEMTDIPLGTLSKLLAGICESPKLSNIVAIAGALNCSLDWLMTGIPENTNNYTLDPGEIAVMEQYRTLDAYGKELLEAVMSMECDRVRQQQSAGFPEETAGLSGEALHRRGQTGKHRRKVLPGDTGSDRGSATEEMPHYTVASSPLKPTGTATLLSPIPLSVPSENADPTGVTPPPFVREGHSDSLPAGLRRRTIRLYDLPVSAGVGEFLLDGSSAEIRIPDNARTSEADYALRVSGDSMEPTYRNGDVLLVQTAESVEEGELGIFILDGSGYFKKYGGDCLISLNEAYAPIQLKDFASAACCGRVVGKLKRK